MVFKVSQTRPWCARAIRRRPSQLDTTAPGAELCGEGSWPHSTLGQKETERYRKCEREQKLAVLCWMLSPSVLGQLAAVAASLFANIPRTLLRCNCDKDV